MELTRADRHRYIYIWALSYCSFHCFEQRVGDGQTLLLLLSVPCSKGLWKTSSTAWHSDADTKRLYSSNLLDAVLTKSSPMDLRCRPGRPFLHHQYCVLCLTKMRSSTVMWPIWLVLSGSRGKLKLYRFFCSNHDPPRFSSCISRSNTNTTISNCLHRHSSPLLKTLKYPPNLVQPRIVTSQPFRTTVQDLPHTANCSGDSSVSNVSQQAHRWTIASCWTAGLQIWFHQGKPFEDERWDM